MVKFRNWLPQTERGLFCIYLWNRPNSSFLYFSRNLMTSSCLNTLVCQKPPSWVKMILTLTLTGKITTQSRNWHENWFLICVLIWLIAVPFEYTETMVELTELSSSILKLVAIWFFFLSYWLLNSSYDYCNKQVNGYHLLSRIWSPDSRFKHYCHF